MGACCKYDSGTASGTSRDHFDDLTHLFVARVCLENHESHALQFLAHEHSRCQVVLRCLMVHFSRSRLNSTTIKSYFATIVACHSTIGPAGSGSCGGWFRGLGRNRFAARVTFRFLPAVNWWLAQEGVSPCGAVISPNLFCIEACLVGLVFAQVHASC